MSAGVRVSARTKAILFGGLALVAVLYALIRLGVGGENGPVVISDVGETAIGLVGAAFILYVAWTFRGQPFARPWTLIGLGLGAFALGDLVWTIIEVGMGKEPPYPGLPDLFYVFQYLFMGAGLIITALAYRGLVDLKAPLAGATAVTVFLAVFVSWLVLMPIVTDSEVELAEKALSVFYPLGDLLLLLGPTLVIIFMVSRLGGGALARPWWAVAAGIAVMAASDTAFSYLEWHDLYESGMIVDVGWMAGGVFLATAASLARDLVAPRARPT